MSLSDTSFHLLQSRQQDAKCLSFIIRNVDRSIINAIRRILYREVCCAAISFNNESIKTNTTVMSNEYLLNRISLIPLNLTPEEIDNFETKNYLFVLKKQNVHSEILNVTAADFVIYDQNNKQYNESVTQRIFECNPITKDNK